MAGLLPGPYEELSPDGRRYFKILGVSSHLIRMYELLLEASDLAAVRPGTGGKAQSLQIDLLIREIKSQVEGAARRTAAYADEQIRAEIEATRVRPPSTGKSAHSSLLGAILSRPVESILPGGGAVGIADVAELIHGTLNPSTNSQTPYYWRAQEFGSDHLVGHTLYGVFQPGEAAPAGPGPNRTHPFFEVRGKGEGTSYKMVVRNPIEERAFLRKGGFEAYEFRRGLHRDTEAIAVDRMRQIAAGR